jgi:drug/metabolite transporter (DMT)-like permease
VNRNAAWLFIAVSVFWGIPYALIRIALEGFDPAAIVLVRVSIGALVLIPIAARRPGALKAALKKWPWVLAFGVIEMAGPWILLTSAEQHISSSLAGLLIGAVPFFALPLAYFMGDKTVFHPKTITGLVVGFGGLVALAGIDSFTGHLDPIWLGAMILACLGYAIAPAIASAKLDSESSIAVVGLSLAMVAVIYAIPGGAALSSSISANPPTASWLALLGLGVLCTAAAFTCFFQLISHIGSARATMVVYPNLAVAFLLGIVFLKEPITTGFLIGVPMVIVGSWLATQRHESKTRTAAKA